MTTKTRRTLFLSLLVLALTLPAETILLKALQSPSDAAAIQKWADDLDPPEAQAAASRIQSYPFAYRKQIMRVLSPEARSSVWRDHIQSYMQQHPELDSSAVETLRGAIAAATPEAMSEKASPTTRMSTAAVADQVQGLLGKDIAKYLLYYIGDPDGTGASASAEPLTMKLASYVRNHFVVLARSPSCDCATYYGCDSGEATCSTASYCDADNSWPMCGWFWNSSCNGLCS